MSDVARMRFDSHSVTTHCTAIMHKPQRSRLFSVRRRPRRTGSSRHAQDTSSVAGLLVTLGALSVTLRAFVTATRARRLRAAKRARPYSPLSLSHVAFPLLSQSHIPSYYSSMSRARRQPFHASVNVLHASVNVLQPRSARHPERLSKRRTCNPSVRPLSPTSSCVDTTCTS